MAEHEVWVMIGVGLFSFIFGFLVAGLFRSSTVTDLEMENMMLREELKGQMGKGT